MVLSRNTYANNRKVVDSLLHSSLHRNGAPIMKQGGVFGSDGGTYGDYLAKEGLRRFADGGWMEQINDDPGGSSGGDSGGSGSYDGGFIVGRWGLRRVGCRNEGPTRCQSADPGRHCQEHPGAATALDKALLLLADVQAQIKLESTNQQTATGCNQMTGSQDRYRVLQLRVPLQFAMHTDMTALQGTMKVELPSLGTDLLNQLMPCAPRWC